MIDTQNSRRIQHQKINNNKTIEKKDKKVASEALLDANKVLDRMAGKKVITPNKAARTKSRLNKKVKVL